MKLLSGPERECVSTEKTEWHAAATRFRALRRARSHQSLTSRVELSRFFFDEGRNSLIGLADVVSQPVFKKVH